MATSQRLPRPSTPDALTASLAAVRRTIIPTPEEARALGRRIQAGDEAAVQELVERNLRFVVHVAKRYEGYGLPLADLIQEGTVGLLHAARKFDPERGVHFLTYAVWWIRQTMLHALAAGSGPVRLPIRQAEALVKVRQQVEDIHHQEGRDPTPAEVALALEMPLETVEDLLRVSRPPVSLDAPRHDDSPATRLEGLQSGSLPSSEDAVVQASIVREVQDLLAHLEVRDAQILRARFGFDGPAQSLAAIGRELGLSRQRVQQLETRACTKLRKLAQRTARTPSRR